MIQYVLTVSQYMQDRSVRENHTILVKAEDEEKAEQTLNAYWEKKSDQYGTNYFVSSQEIIPSIKQEDYLDIKVETNANPENDEFVCTHCHEVFDIEDSIKKGGHLYCDICAEKVK